MTEQERRAAELRGGADALEDMAAWCQRPDFRSGVYGFCSAAELAEKAQAMRAALAEIEGKQ